MMTSAGLFSAENRGLTFSTMTVVAVASYNSLSVSAALPSIGDDLGSLNLLPWIVTIELITAAIAVLAVGPLIDALGTRTIFRTSLVAFAVTSVGCALAPNMIALIIARGLLGFTSGALIANVMAAMGLGVPEALRPRAYATNSSVWGIMGLAGPALAALILTVSGWPGIFLVNVPVAFICGVVGWNIFPGPADRTNSARPDRLGLAIMASFTLISLGAVSSLGWWTPVAVVISIALAFAYFRHERSVEQPVLRMRHVIDSKFRVLHTTAFLVIASGIAANAFLPVYVKGARGGTTAGAAFSVVFLTFGWTAGAFVSSRVSEVRRGEVAVLIGVVVLAVSTTLVAVGVVITAPLWILFAGFTGVGFSLGAVASSGLALMQSKAEQAEMGRVNSAHQFIRTLGFSYGAAVGGAILFGVVAARLGDADVVRDLLGEDDVAVSRDVIDALEAGFAWSAIVAAILSYGALWFGVALNRTSEVELVSR